MRRTLLVALALLAPHHAGAETEARITTGFDEAVAPLSLALRRISPALTVGGELTIPMLRPDLGDLRWTSWIELPVLRRGPWVVIASAGATITTTRNDVMSGGTLGSMVGAAAGWRGRRWQLGAEVAQRTGWLTYLRTTEDARRYNGVVSEGGWYRNTSLGLEVGGRAAVAFGRTRVEARAGYERRGKLDLAIPPVYVTFGVARTW